MSKEAMKLALEALEYIEHNYMSLPAPAEKAITALREALAEQPAQQEPVAWRYTDARGHYRYRGFVANFDKKYPMLKPQPLYTSPIAQQEPFQNNPFDCGVYLGSGKDYAIKHHVSYGPAQQEPFGYFKAEPFGWTDCAETDEGAVALYERPAQRTWVGLTDEEANKIYKDGSTFGEMMRMVEAKLRSKNEDRN